MDFTTQLANADFSLKQPLVVDLFQNDKFNETSLIPADYPQRTILIKNLATLHFFAMYNVKILTHAITLIADAHEDLTRRCTAAVLQSFDVMDMPIKMLSLQFFLEQMGHEDSEYCRVGTRILLQSFETIDKCIMHWKIHDQEHEFVTALVRFLSEEKKLAKFCETTDDCDRLFDFCFDLIERKQEIRSRDYGDLITGAYRCLRNILKKHITSPQIDKVKHFVVEKQNVTIANLLLMEYCVLKECKINNSLYTWTFGCELAEEILNRLERAGTSDEINGEYCFLLTGI